MAIRRASRLRHRVAIERRDKSFNTLGHESAAWQEIATVFAEVLDLSGRELERAKQQVAEATAQVTIRFFDGLTTKERFRFGSRLFQIAAIRDPNGTKKEMICTCSELK